MEEGTTNREAPADEIRVLPPRSEPEAGSQPNVEATINPKALEDALQNALKNYLPRLESTSDPRTEFYNKFKREADEYDNDFLGKYRGDLDTTLIFAGLFSTVTSAFIVAIQIQLQPDYTQLSYDILRVMAEDKALNILAKPSSDSPWTGPDPNLVHVQAILFSSLAGTLLAALTAMLGKQWLNRYSQVDMHGSLTDRGRDRQRKMNGMENWGFKFVMECLPLMLQGALLLLGCALSKYLFTVDNLVAWVVLGFTTSGCLFYLVIVVAAITSYDCPFQTPLSLIVHFMVRLFNERGKYLKRSRKWFSRTFSRKSGWWTHPPGGPDSGGPNEDGSTQLTAVISSHPLPLPFEKGTDLHSHVLDSNCIAWMFEMSTDPDVVLDIIKFIPEITWHNGIRTVPLEKLYDTIVECLDHSSGHPVVIPKSRNKAYFSAKALVHLAIQRKCMGDESDTAMFDPTSRPRLQNIGSTHYEGDSDLESTLWMMDRVFGAGNLAPMRWAEFSFTCHHHAWMGQILPYRAWYALRTSDNLPDDIHEFLRDSLGKNPLPPAPIISSCLLIICLVLRATPDSDDRDQSFIESQKLRSRLSRIYQKLAEIFREKHPVGIQINFALEVIRWITALPENKVAKESYELFCALEDAPDSLGFSEERGKASRLALHAAYKWDGELPRVEEPKPILPFLSINLESLVLGGDRRNEESVQDAFRALTSASSPKTSKALEDFKWGKPAYALAICALFQESKPLQLRKATLFFLPLIADKLFNASYTLVEPDEMKRTCVGWASTVNEVLGSEATRGVAWRAAWNAALTVLLNMINSFDWRYYVPQDQWKLLGNLDLSPNYSPPLRRCLENKELVDSLSRMENPEPITLWSNILLLNYNQLNRGVRDQLAASMRDVQRERIDDYLSMVESKLEGYVWVSGPFEEDSSPDDKWNNEVEGLGAAKEFLESLKRDDRQDLC